MSIFDIGSCQEKPPPGCFWTTAPPEMDYKSQLFKVGAVAVGEPLWWLDCDCHRTGKCQAGEPPPPPIFEFLQRDKGHAYTDIEVPGPTQFWEARTGAYDYHWAAWHNPYAEGPGRKQWPSAHGPAHTASKRDEDPPDGDAPDGDEGGPPGTAREKDKIDLFIISKEFRGIWGPSVCKGTKVGTIGSDGADGANADEKKDTCLDPGTARRHPRDLPKACTK